MAKGDSYLSLPNERFQIYLSFSSSRPWLNPASLKPYSYALKYLNYQTESEYIDLDNTFASLDPEVRMEESKRKLTKKNKGAKARAAAEGGDDGISLLNEGITEIIGADESKDKGSLTIPTTYGLWMFATHFIFLTCPRRYRQ